MAHLESWIMEKYSWCTILNCSPFLGDLFHHRLDYCWTKAVFVGDFESEDHNSFNIKIELKSGKKDLLLSNLGAIQLSLHPIGRSRYCFS